MQSIPQTFIDDLVQRIDVVELINARVRLKKRGKEWIACCPFHQEKTPSFTVNQQKQFYHCFGCGEHGTAIGFLMKYDRLGFVDAVKELAESVGLEVPNQAQADPKKAKRQQRLWDTSEQACQQYQQALKQADAAIDYLKNRGLDGRTAAQFKLGFAPNQWDFLTRNAHTDEQKTALVDAGLITHNDKKTYDRFRGRIMFPIQDIKQRVIGFGGRLMDKGEPKYLNSPETDLFFKSRALYNIHRARQAQSDTVLVVEGYMDVIALAQFGITEVVATMGTAATAQHIEQLWRYFDNIIFCFDGDQAGHRAAWRALENALPKLRAAHSAQFLILPKGHDPDSLVRRDGADAFRSRMQTAQSLSAFFIDKLSQDHDQSIEGRSKLIETARPLLKRIQDPVFRELLTDELARFTRATPETLMPHQAVTPKVTKAAETQARGSLIRQALSVIVLHPEAISSITDRPALDTLDQPGADLLREMCDTLTAQPAQHTAQLLERFRDHAHHHHLLTLASQESLVSAEHAGTELLMILHRLMHVEPQKARIHELLAKESQAGLSETEKLELRELL